MNEHLLKAMKEFFAAVCKAGEGEAADKAKEVYRALGGDVKDLEVVEEVVEEEPSEDPPADDPAEDQD